jgi:hypothetical protein
LRDRVLLAIEWVLATTAALVVTHLFIEILGAALLGYFLFLILPLTGGAIVGLLVGFSQWLVLRRRTGDRGQWIAYTILGIGAAWLLTMVFAAIAFVAPSGLSGMKAFLSFALASPVIGAVQTTVLRRWTSHTWMWVVASTAGWSALAAIEMFRSEVLPGVDHLIGMLVSSIAGYQVTSNVGATLLGGFCTGAVTGIALAAIWETRR